MVPLSRRGLQGLAAALALLLAAGCAHAPRGAREEPAGQGRPRAEAGPAVEGKPDAEGQPIAEGMASYYGAAFRGRLTANGERFNPDAMTAAHRTLAFGTCLRVENLANGRAVRVRVNDRGPYAHGRILDLSEGAARALDLVRQGIARVRLFLCR